MRIYSLTKRLSKGKCPFRVYMPSKPAKYDMKIWVVADCEQYTVDIWRLIWEKLAERLNLSWITSQTSFWSITRKKGAVDTLDKLCCQYSTKRGTQRRPLSMFFMLLDICLHNCSVIWFNKYPVRNEYPASRRSDVGRMFILELGKQLCMPWVEQRAARPLTGLQPSVKRATEYVNGPEWKKPTENVTTATSYTF